MATVAASDNFYQSLSHVLFTWAPLTTSGDVGAQVDYGPGAGGRSIQVTGTFGTSGSVSIEGSNDGQNWYVLNDLSGAALTFTSAGLKGVREDTLYLRPHLTAGTGTISLVCSFVVRKNNLG